MTTGAWGEEEYENSSMLLAQGHSNRSMASWSGFGQTIISWGMEQSSIYTKAINEEKC